MKSIFIGLMLLMVSGCGKSSPNNSIVMLKGNDMSCTGFEVIAPSGKQYTLTAGHCEALESLSGEIQATKEDGTSVMVKAIQLSKESDSLILDPVPGLPALQVADTDAYNEDIRIVGHGYGLPLWEVRGKILIDMAMLDWQETVVSCGAAPGHSGSPVLDPQNHVVGILSVSNGVISGFVRIQDLKALLAGY